MTHLGAYELNPGQLLRLSATAAIAWAPAMTALGLLAWGKLSAPLGFLIGLAGIFASLAVIIVRIARPRRQPISVSPDHARAGSQLASGRQSTRQLREPMGHVRGSQRVALVTRLVGKSRGRIRRHERDPQAFHSRSRVPMSLVTLSTISRTCVVSPTVRSTWRFSIKRSSTSLTLNGP